METILIRCPHCKEEMQAPQGRDSILCMFCGEKIDLTKAEAIPSGNVQEQGNAEKCFENLNKALEQVDGAFDGYREKVRAFRKDTYAGLFEDYKAKNYAFFISVKQALMNAGEADLEGVCHQIARAFVTHNEKEMELVKKKNEKFAAQMDSNMFMVTYVLPSLKEMKNKRADELAEVICKEWGAAFKDSNIMASDYESISQGFKRKLCYVTTAVCQNLNKGEDCEELRLIKDFRDGYLSSTKEGLAMIEDYYDIAPTLVKRIAKDEKAGEKYRWLWDTWIAPCVELIKSGNNEACKKVYCDMVDTLRKEYMGRVV